MAASHILDLVRTKGYRYRDMAVVARDWEKYSAAAENTFEKYGIPVMTSEKSDILEKPIIRATKSTGKKIYGGQHISVTVKAVNEEAVCPDGKE